MEKILITGGLGLIGKELSRLLLDLGYQIAILSRRKLKAENMEVFKWDTNKKTIEKNALKDVGYIIHLAGAGISDKRWTKKRKQEIIDSRVESANFLFEEVKKQNIKLKAFISASAIGFYGAKTSDEIFTEDSPGANDFLGRACKVWEEAADNFSTLCIRTVKFRIGVVLSEKGGAFKKMTQSLAYRVLSIIGSGKQYMPWIHLSDLSHIFLEAVKNDKMQGTYNAVAPEHVTNAEFTEAIERNYPIKTVRFPVPGFVFKLIFGEMSSILLYGSRVSSEKVKEYYQFRFPELDSAIQAIFSAKQKP